jgi:hypothetical protein
MFGVAEVEIPGNECAGKKWKYVYTECIDALCKLRDEILFQRSLSSFQIQANCHICGANIPEILVQEVTGCYAHRHVFVNYELRIAVFFV